MDVKLPIVTVGLLLLCSQAELSSQIVDTCDGGTNIFNCYCDSNPRGSHATRENDYSKPICEWKRVYKAVSGNGQSIRDDFLAEGGINENYADAKTIASSLVFRDDSVLDNWNQHIIDKVRIDVYEGNTRMAWFLYDGIGSTIEDWMSKARLIASPYDKTKEKTQNYHSILGDETHNRRFFINRNYEGCEADCGFLVVSDAGRGTACKFERQAAKPIILYSSRKGNCGLWDRPTEYGVADRFVVSVKECREDW